MTNAGGLDWDELNETNYEDLLVSIEASRDKLNLLIAVCDDSYFRERIIERYESELAPEIGCYRIKLARGEPSLRAGIEELVKTNPHLQPGRKAVLTVTGAEQLFRLRLGAERSEQEIFWGYLQWTREGLREFPYSIVLWITKQMEAELGKNAPDFWSWRKGVFRFTSKTIREIPKGEIQGFPVALDSELIGMKDDDLSFIPLGDLQVLIQQTQEKWGVKNPGLVTLYTSMGDIYKRRLERGEFEDYQTELARAIEYYNQAVALQEALGMEADLAISLNSLAELYDSQGRYDEAEPLYREALALFKRLLGENHPDVATSLNNLAELYHSQGKYDEAEPLFLEALALRKHLLGDNHPDVATSFNNLALLYKSQGRYDEAEPLYREALALRKRLLGENHPDVATSLNNLALLYHSQGRYEEAEPLFIEALALRKRLRGENHPDVANSLNNLALLYDSQGKYDEAEPLYREALALAEQTLGMNHPHTMFYRQNLQLLRDR